MNYLRPPSLAEALDALHRIAGARVLAGGTDLVVLMRDRVIRPDALVDISELPELRRVEASDGGALAVGAGMRLADLEEDERVPDVLRAACAQVGTPQVRSLATIGGNVCNASPAGDTITPLLALGATARVASTAGVRNVPLAKFFAGPKQTVLRPDEILVSVIIGLKARQMRTSFMKMGRRRETVISQVNVAVALAVSASGVAEKARVALGAVAATPVRAAEAEALLTGRSMSPQLIAQAAVAAAGSIRPISDVRASAGYRLHLTEVLTRRALTEAWTGEGA